MIGTRKFSQTSNLLKDKGILYIEFGGQFEKGSPSATSAKEIHNFNKELKKHTFQCILANFFI